VEPKKQTLKHFLHTGFHFLWIWWIFHDNFMFGCREWSVAEIDRSLHVGIWAGAMWAASVRPLVRYGSHGPFSSMMFVDLLIEHFCKIVIFHSKLLVYQRVRWWFSSSLCYQITIIHHQILADFNGILVESNGCEWGFKQQEWGYEWMLCPLVN